MKQVSGFQYLYQKLKRIKWLILLKNSTNTVLEWTKTLADNNKIVKRIFNLDTNMLLVRCKNKELGLVASAVLRCDDCVNTI
jgi:hypothetical protein